MSWLTLGIVVVSGLGIVMGVAQVVRWGYVPTEFDDEQAANVRAGWFLIVAWVLTLMFMI